MMLSRRIAGRRFLATLVGALLALGVGCEGDDGAAGPPGADGAPGSQPGNGDGALNAIVLEILGISGAGRTDGNFRSGDTISVTFSVKNEDGEDLDLSELDTAAAMVSGPTFNYQRVLERQTDLITASTENPDGTYTYTFPVEIPEEYLAPLNDSDSFDEDDGELTGQALLAGTYTLGLEAYKDVEDEEGETRRESGNATHDFLLGSAEDVEEREVVALGNCNRCHTTIQAHGGIRINDVKLCLLCHTSGAEDRNVPSVEGGTPGATIDFRIMIHKIHNAKHLPSVLGVATNSNGSRNYAATAQPYQLVGFGNNVHDYSAVGFPAWPNLSHPMPRDQGYTALTSGQKTTEDTIRAGMTECAKCHGDPDGGGPLEAPAQGDLAYVQSTRRACGSCHDDIDWERAYTANGQTMPEDRPDSTCVLCHPASGNSLAVEDAHLHPLYDATYNPGLNVDVTAVSEAGTNDDDGTLDPGEKIAITFTMEDDAGAAVAPGSVASMNVVISGPRENRNLILNGSIPLGALSGSQPYTVNVPRAYLLEHVGDSTAATGDVFTTSLTPHWNMSGAATTVLVRTATSGGASTLDEAAAALDNYIDIDPDSTSGFARNDYLVLEDGVSGQEEYVQVTLVDGSRLWVNPPLRHAHDAGASADEVTLTTQIVTTAYTLTAASGTVTEVAEFGDGAAVLVSYTSDLVLPSVFPPAINDSPAFDESFGDWKGLALLDGTYSLGLWASRNVVVNLYSETQTYRGTSLTSVEDFLVGDASEVEEYTLISSADNCNSCHTDVMFHGGGRRGFDNCILCHGTAGSEDRARYTAGNAPATDETTIDFRNMLHKIHMGEELSQGSDYVVVGFGAGAYPNNYTAHTYEEVVFPSQPSGVKNCVSCHGTAESWREPAARTHPDETLPARTWYAACNSCHDSPSALAHAATQTFGGEEACSVCHGSGREFAADQYHED